MSLTAPNEGILLFWVGWSLIAFDILGFSAAGVVLILGWFVSLSTDGGYS